VILKAKYSIKEVKTIIISILKYLLYLGIGYNLAKY
jgi:hypothetical protein